MGLISKIKEIFAWRKLAALLKVIFRGALLLAWAEFQELAIAAAQEVATKGLPTDEEKRHEFERIMREKTRESGKRLSDSLLNYLREEAVLYLKSATG